MVVTNMKPQDPWTDKHESYFEALQQDCQVKAKAHARAARKNLFCKYLIGYPSMVVPLTMSALNMVFDPCDTSSLHWSKYTNAILFLVVATLNTTTSFFKFSEDHQMHSTFENFYLNIKSDIGTELIKPTDYRVPVDVFVAKIQTRMDFTNADAPDMPPTYCCLLHF